MILQFLQLEDLESQTPDEDTPRLCLFHEGRLGRKKTYFSWCRKCVEAEKGVFIQAHPGETRDEEDRLP